MYYRDVLGIGDIDAVNRRVTFRFAEVPLTHCAGTIPVGKGAVTLSWTKQDGEFRYAYTVPKGFDVTVDTSRLTSLVPKKCVTNQQQH